MKGAVRGDVVLHKDGVYKIYIRNHDYLVGLPMEGQGGKRKLPLDVRVIEKGRGKK